MKQRINEILTYDRDGGISFEKDFVNVRNTTNVLSFIRWL